MSVSCIREAVFLFKDIIFSVLAMANMVSVLFLNSTMCTLRSSSDKLVQCFFSSNASEISVTEILFN